MNLQNLVEQYVQFRRALGERFDTNAVTLTAFSKALGQTVDIRTIDEDSVNAFLAGNGPITHSWFVRYDALNGFFHYLSSRGYVTTVPLPANKPKRPPPFAPYIYTTDELRLIVKATATYQRNRSCIEPATVRAIILTLYGTGIRIGEAVALDRQDIDFEESIITVRETKFYKSRLVPFGPNLSRVLLEYMNRLNAPASPAKASSFFTSRAGGRMQLATMEASFRRVREHAGIRRTDGASHQPRLHDLRHTAAVHRIVAWYRQGLDVQRLLPHLSVYLGHAKLAATQVYLTMTPELLQEANTRFEKYAEEMHG